MSRSGSWPKVTGSRTDRARLEPEKALVSRGQDRQRRGRASGGATQLHPADLGRPREAREPLHRTAGPTAGWQGRGKPPGRARRGEARGGEARAGARSPDPEPARPRPGPALPAAPRLASAGYLEG